MKQRNQVLVTQRKWIESNDMLTTVFPIFEMRYRKNVQLSNLLSGVSYYQL